MPPPSPPQFNVSVLGHEPRELMQAGAGCLASGAYTDAEHLFRALTVREPWNADAWFRLASAEIAQGKTETALATMATACDIAAQTLLHELAPEWLTNGFTEQKRFELAEALYGGNMMASASHLFQRLTANHPERSHLRLSLGLSLMHQGRAEEAIAVFESLERTWSHPNHHSFLHYARAFRQEPEDVVYQESLRWAERHTARIRPHPKRAIARPGGKLRIGYFSPMFNAHQVTKFFLPVFEHHDRSRVSLYCYSMSPPKDEVGARIQSLADSWQEVSHLDDETLANLIEEDEIDILVDLWGHTAGNRLPMFARHPAPLVVSWLNYVETTGLTAFDYVLHADGFDLPGAQALYTETILPIGPILAPFRQSADIPPPGPTPMATTGYPNFGAYIHPGKLNLKVVETWSAILKAAPSAMLTLRSAYFADPVLRRAVVARFEAFGVSSERLVFPPFLSGAAFLQSYQEVDLILDPFPYQGMTTTLDALSAGIPVLAVEGRRMNDRVASTTLRNCGLETLVASSVDDYVARAVDLVSDVGRLNALRARIQPALAASPFRDEAGFTRRLEDIFEAMAVKAEDAVPA